MARRFAFFVLLLAIVALGGCAYGTAARLTPAQERARISLLESHKGFSDRDLAKLCPGLYPRDFLTNSKKWPAGKAATGDRSASAIAAARTTQAAALSAAGCDVYPG